MIGLDRVRTLSAGPWARVEMIERHNVASTSTQPDERAISRLRVEEWQKAVVQAVVRNGTWSTGIIVIRRSIPPEGPFLGFSGTGHSITAPGFTGTIDLTGAAWISFETTTSQAGLEVDLYVLLRRSPFPT